MRVWKISFGVFGDNRPDFHIYIAGGEIVDAFAIGRQVVASHKKKSPTIIYEVLSVELTEYWIDGIFLEGKLKDVSESGDLFK